MKVAAINPAPEQMRTAKPSVLSPQTDIAGNRLRSQRNALGNRGEVGEQSASSPPFPINFPGMGSLNSAVRHSAFGIHKIMKTWTCRLLFYRLLSPSVVVVRLPKDRPPESAYERVLFWSDKGLPNSSVPPLMVVVPEKVLAPEPVLKREPTRSRASERSTVGGLL